MLAFLFQNPWCLFVLLLTTLPVFLHHWFFYICFWSKNFRPTSLIDFSFQSTVLQGMKCCLQAMRHALPVSEVITRQMREMLSLAVVRHAQRIPQIMWLLFLRLTVTSVSMTLGFPHTFVIFVIYLSVWFSSKLSLIVIMPTICLRYIPYIFFLNWKRSRTGLIFQPSRSTRVTPMLHFLHWLLIEQTIMG